MDEAKIDEDEIREKAEDEAGERLKEACVRTYCVVLDAIRLMEANPDNTRLVSCVMRRDHYDQIA